MTDSNSMSPLRRRMIDDMTVRNLSPATQRSYLHAGRRGDRNRAQLQGGAGDRRPGGGAGGGAGLGHGLIE